MKNRSFLLCLILGMALPATWVWADSVRLAPEPGYGVNDYVMQREGTGYHGGLDIGYAQVATGSGAAKTRCILKTENYGGGIGGNAVRVSLYGYTGERVANFGDVTGLTSAWAQACRLSPDQTEIIYSYTDWGGGGDFYSIELDPDTLQPVSGATPQQPFGEPMMGNWEVEYDPESGLPFVAGKMTQWGPDTHSIWVWDEGSDDWREIVDVTGWSCGFAFDLEGNLWTGTYTSSGPTDIQYLRMYTAQQIADTLAGDPALLPEDAALELELPYDVQENWYMGANDVESGTDGTIYVTCNSGWTMAYDSEVGFVVSVENNGVDTEQEDMKVLAVSIPTDDSDWQKALAYDGESYLEDPSALGYTDPTQQPDITGNRLYVDQDTMAQGGGSDIVTGLAVDADYDEDGVPDAMDNAYMISNAGQQDTDLDLYGNRCDCDVDNNGIVAGADFAILQADWASSGPHTDFDSNGTVAGADFGIFSERWAQQAPFFD
jgi:hypothetical protein